MILAVAIANGVDVVHSGDVQAMVSAVRLLVGASQAAAPEC